MIDFGYKEKGRRNVAKLKSKAWIWGHPANSLVGCAAIPEGNATDPVEGMKQLNAENIFWIHFGRGPENRRESAMRMDATCQKFGYRLMPNRSIDQILAERAEFSHLSVAAYDDFFCEEWPQNNYTVHPASAVREERRRLNEVGVELWCVHYERHIEQDISEYLDAFDGFTFWFWSQQPPEVYESTLAKFIERTPKKRRMLGIYLYDFGRRCPADPDLVERELERAEELIRNGVIEGFILHTNAVADLGYEGYDRAVAWMKAHADDEV